MKRILVGSILSAVILTSVVSTYMLLSEGRLTRTSVANTCTQTPFGKTTFIPSSAEPRSKQTKLVSVKSEAAMNPMIQWFSNQAVTKFKASSDLADQEGHPKDTGWVDAVSNPSNPTQKFPVRTTFTEVFDSSPYERIRGQFSDEEGSPYATTNIIDIEISKNPCDNNFRDGGPDKTFEGVEIRGANLNQKYIEVVVKTGANPSVGNYEFSQAGFISPGSSTDKRQFARYEIHGQITWWGVARQQKEIRITGTGPKQIGDSTTLTAQVKTTGHQASDWVSVYNGATTKLTWKVADPTIASISNGTVKLLKRGQTVVSANWEKDGYNLIAYFNVGGLDDDITGGCTVDCGCKAPSKVDSLTRTSAAPNPTGVVLADSRDSSLFDVSKGIPVTESLYANVVTRNFMYNYTLDKMAGDCTYEVTVSKTYNFNWTEIVGCGSYPDGSPCTTTQLRTDDETVTKRYKVVRPYAYWVINKADVWGLKQATLEQYALPYGGTTLIPTGYKPPIVDLHQESIHIQEPSVTPKHLGAQTVSGGSYRPSTPSEDWTSVAEAHVGKVKVQNDRVIIDNKTIMTNTLTDTEGPAPIPTLVTLDVPYTSRDVLYKSDMLIASNKQNGEYETKGTMSYQSLGSVNGDSGVQVFTIGGLKPVTIHTPVVNYSSAPDNNRPFDQSMNPDTSRTVLVLGRNFVINFPESGQHRDILGYGNKNYSKYLKSKTIIFPFDVYQGSTFYLANTMIELPLGVDNTTFMIPYWVPEGNYVAGTFAHAINNETNTYEQSFNSRLTSYVAHNELRFNVVGRVSAFRITDIGDLRFEKVFRTAVGNKTHSGVKYASGGKDRDGKDNSFAGKSTFQLPIRPGSHPTQVATTPHNGYPIDFEFDTIGDYWSTSSGVTITPTFWFVSNKGGTAKRVDLYYNSSGSNNKMIKVGTEKDKSIYTRKMQLGETLRAVPRTELSDAASYEYNFIKSAEFRQSNSWDKFSKSYLSRKSNLGAGYGLISLNHEVRTLIGPKNIPEGVNSVNALRSIQRWYGTYNLPISPYILEYGTNILDVTKKYGGAINGKEEEFLKNGYIIVNFDIKVHKNGNVNNPSIGYISPNENMWRREQQIRSATSYLGRAYNFSYGDVAMFESDFSVANDYH